MGAASRIITASGGPARHHERVHVFCETERLVLRRFTEEDVDNLVELHADPAVMRYINGGRPTPRAEIRDGVLPRAMRYHDDRPACGRWAAVEKASGEFIGWFALRPPEPPGSDRGDTDPGTVELGYRLRRSAWGKGYATEGARALIEKSFLEYGVRRVVAYTMAVNTASRRVMEKAGLAHVRTLYVDWPDPIEGAEAGEVEYAVDRADWVARDPAASS
jgi:RimJ/RimL family protein N-acetyltransferase